MCRGHISHVERTQHAWFCWPTAYQMQVCRKNITGHSNSSPALVWTNPSATPYVLFLLFYCRPVTNINGRAHSSVQFLSRAIGSRESTSPKTGRCENMIHQEGQIQWISKIVYPSDTHALFFGSYPKPLLSVLS